MVLIFFWFGLSLSYNLIPAPYSYVFLPDELLSAIFTSSIRSPEVAYCLISLFVLSLLLFSLAALIFQRLQIKRGQE